MEDVLISALLGAIGDKCTKSTVNSAHLNTMGEQVVNRVMKSTGSTKKELQSALKYYFSQTWDDNAKMLKDTAKSALPSVGKEVYDMYSR